jgi:hypothetical protein
MRITYPAKLSSSCTSFIDKIFSDSMFFISGHDDNLFDPKVTWKYSRARSENHAAGKRNSGWYPAQAPSPTQRPSG